MQLTMIAPLGDETKFGQHLATELLSIGVMTGKLEDACKILMFGGVNLRINGLTRELQAEVWERIHKGKQPARSVPALCRCHPPWLPLEVAVGAELLARLLCA